MSQASRGGYHRPTEDPQPSEGAGQDPGPAAFDIELPRSLSFHGLRGAARAYGSHIIESLESISRELGDEPRPQQGEEEGPLTGLGAKIQSIMRQESGPLGFDRVSLDGAGAGQDESNSFLHSDKAGRGSSHGFGGASRASAIFNLSTTIVGAGIMALPATMRVLGLPLGLVIIVIMGYLSEMSIEMMLVTSTARRVWSYGDLVAGAFGSKGRLVLQLAIVVNNVGICIAYLIIIADVLSGTNVASGEARHTGLLEEWAGDTFYTTRFFVLLCTTLFVLGPLVAQKHVDNLRFTSALSIALALVYLVISAGVFLLKLAEGRIGLPHMLPNIGSTEDLLQLCSIIPVMSNAFICHFNVHPIYVELKDRAEPTMRGVARTSLLLCTLVYLAASLSGYLLFGEDTASDVLANFDKDLGVPGSETLDDIVRVGYAVHVMLVFPLLNFSLRQNVDELIFTKAAMPLEEDTCRFVVVTVSLMGLIFMGAVLVPDIWIAFKFTGATSAVLIGFIFPALMALRDETGFVSRGLKRVAWYMLVLAVLVGIIGVFSNVIDTVRGELQSSLYTATAPMPAPSPNAAPGPFATPPMRAPIAPLHAPPPHIAPLMAPVPGPAPGPTAVPMPA